MMWLDHPIFMQLFQIQEFDELLCDGTLNFSGKRNEKATDISVAFFVPKSFQKQPKDLLIRFQIP